jgi:CheY-like chemotaxis protein
VDLILLDIEMPGLSGIDLFTIIKGNPMYAAIPVVFVTAHAQSDIIGKAMDLGAKGYIVKPFKGSDLIDKIAEVLTNE